MECVSSQLFKRFFLENFWQAAVSLRFLLLNLSVLDLLLADGIYTFNQIQSDWINAFKALVKDIVYFSISSHAEIGTSESNNYQLVKRDKLSIVLVLYLLLCILCIYFWHQFRCYIYSYNDRMLYRPTWPRQRC